MFTYYILSEHVPLPIDNVVVWAHWFEAHQQERIVAQETIGSYLVSTVLLGSDHQYARDGPPLLFETMIFPPPGHEEGWEEYRVRCSTWEEAEQEHALACDIVRLKLRHSPSLDSITA